MSESNVKNINFHSDILNKDMRINVYLPKGYEENNNPLPVLYFLHGRSGNENIIFDLNMKGIADEMIESGKIKPLIIVCPRIENSRGVNSSSISNEVLSPGDSGIIINVGMYEDYFIKEVVPLIDNMFNTIKTKMVDILVVFQQVDMQHFIIHLDIKKCLARLEDICLQ